MDQAPNPAPPDGVGGAPSLVETHTGVVCLLGERAYKWKKPVRFDFVDFSSLATRRAACHREVELNRRLSPDVYLGVADVVGPDRRVCEHMVVMRRLPAGRSLAALLARGEPVIAHLEALARLLAGFHARAERSAEIDGQVSASALRRRWAANGAQLHALPPSVVNPVVLAEVERLAHRYLAGRGALLEERVASGRVCDGHGDLLATDVFCMPDGPRVLDCVEFDDALRAVDVLDDVSFLAMDLEHRGRGDLAVTLLERYRALTGDTWPASLAHHYIAYRAEVRALVAALRCEQGDEASRKPAADLLALSLDHLRAGRVRLVLVGGPPATGKSTVAAALGAATGAVVLRSDEIRKQGAGLDPSTPTAPGDLASVYSASATRTTYRELLRRSRLCLARGESVVLDATFGQATWREATRQLSRQTHAELHELACNAPLAVVEDRLAARAQRGGDPSDATAEVARRLAAAADPWPTATVLDTTAAPHDVERSALAALEHPVPS